MRLAARFAMRLAVSGENECKKLYKACHSYRRREMFALYKWIIFSIKFIIPFRLIGAVPSESTRLRCGCIKSALATRVSRSLPRAAPPPPPRPAPAQVVLPARPITCPLVLQCFSERLSLTNIASNKNLVITKGINTILILRKDDIKLVFLNKVNKFHNWTLF